MVTKLLDELRKTKEYQQVPISLFFIGIQVPISLYQYF
jgi:hypothetical protein